MFDLTVRLSDDFLGRSIEHGYSCAKFVTECSIRGDIQREFGLVKLFLMMRDLSLR